MAGNAIRHGTYVEPTLVDSVDFWEEVEAVRNPPGRILTLSERDDLMDDYFDRFETIDSLFN